MSKKSVWDAFAFACARAIREEDPRFASWVCTAEIAKYNWDVGEPKPEGDGMIVYNGDPEAGEVEALRKVLAEAGCKELGYAEYPDAGAPAGHTFVMVIDAGALQDWEVGDLTEKARKRLGGRHPPVKLYYGKITPEVYAAALQLRGDREFCWEDERVPLADPPLVTGADDPEDVFADWVITAWEAALAEAREEYGEGRFVLESLTVYLEGGDPVDADFYWEKNVKVV